MKTARLLYRTRQFWHALTAAPARVDLEQARHVLSPAQFRLFQTMQTSEQAHALQVLHRLLQQGETPSDLQRAALLHDVGKTRYPLRLWERGMIVIAKLLFHNNVIQWGKSAPQGWKRAFAISEQHAGWGAEMAAAAGASALTTSLIRRHQDKLHSHSISLEDQLLVRLQEADDSS